MDYGDVTNEVVGFGINQRVAFANASSQRG